MKNIALLTSAALLIGVTLNSQAIQLKVSSAPAANDKAMLIKAQQKQLTIKIPSNPTTGYRWFVTKYDHNLLTAKAYHYVLPNKKLIGAGGTAEFIFDINPSFHTMPQKTQVVLTYARSWEITQGEVRKVSIVSSD